ncbi:MAG: ABC transporter ATP-binding protein [Beijerinckiaceae bacterium]|nr:ABC transporter ATP-binding protein [Beijerinckiaceae bacterium]
MRRDEGLSLSIRGLSYALRDRSRTMRQILDNVDLSVREGEFVSVVGPSGCGKSTLLNFISHLLPVQQGELEVLGAPVQAFNTKVGYVFQQHALLPWRTVIENTELGLEVKGEGREERRARCREVLAQMGLAGFEDHYPSEISGGMRQRVSLARTLVAEPEFILMDEPFGALDAQTKVLIQEIFLKYWEQHRRSVLFVTHDLGEAIALSDRVVVMSARPGRIIADHVIDLPRPRNGERLRSDPRFIEYHDLLWSALRDEAANAMQVAQ